MNGMITTTRHQIQTAGQGDVHDITDVVALAVSESGLSGGLATASVVGSTAAMTTIECEPGAVSDLKSFTRTSGPARRRIRAS